MNNYLLNKTFAEILSISFFTIPVMVLCNIVFLAIGLRQWKRLGMYWIFIVYGICAIVQDVVALNFIAGAEKEKYGFIWISIFLFITIEFITFYAFFYSVFKGLRIQKWIQRVGIAYVCTSFIALFYLLVIRKADGFELIDYYTLSTSFLVLLPAFYYFYYLFILPPTKDLAKDRTFWINVGIIFIQGILIPLYSFEDYIANELGVWDKIYSINYMAYSVMFLLFSVGMLCGRKGVNV